MFVANLTKTREMKRREKTGILGFFSFGRGTKSTSPRKIVIQKNMIHIVTDEGKIDQEVDINTMDRILMDDPYNVGFGSIPIHYRDISGKKTKNVLILEKDGETQKFEFKIESTNDVREMRKQILYWKSLGNKVIDKNMNIDIG